MLSFRCRRCRRPVFSAAMHINVTDACVSQRVSKEPLAQEPVPTGLVCMYLEAVPVTPADTVQKNLVSIPFLNGLSHYWNWMNSILVLWPEKIRIWQLPSLWFELGLFVVFLGTRYSMVTSVIPLVHVKVKSFYIIKNLKICAPKIIPMNKVAYFLHNAARWFILKASVQVRPEKVGIISSNCIISKDEDRWSLCIRGRPRFIVCVYFG